MSERRSRRTEQNRSSQASFRMRQKQQNELILARLARAEAENAELRSAQPSCATCATNTLAVRSLELRVAALTAELRVGVSAAQQAFAAAAAAASPPSVSSLASSGSPSVLHLGLFGEDNRILPLNYSDDTGHDLWPPAPMPPPAPNVEPFRRALLALPSLHTKQVDELMNMFLAMAVCTDLSAIKRTCMGYVTVLHQMLNTVAATEKPRILAIQESFIVANQRFFEFLGESMQTHAALNNKGDLPDLLAQQAFLSNAPETIKTLQRSLHQIPSLQPYFGVIDELCANLIRFRGDPAIDHADMFFKVTEGCVQLFFLCGDPDDRSQLMLKFEHYRESDTDILDKLVSKIQSSLEITDKEDKS
ncbi:hypothetical protein BJ741DRAFT_598425 [Chytriomyces cf. hyalinus JEL632]|nr:hypothetical protein BJ741DRAFT_598425 [Chytriomyces cf. hyalinus JEL632]